MTLHDSFCFPPGNRLARLAFHQNTDDFYTKQKKWRIVLQSQQPVVIDKNRSIVGAEDGIRTRLVPHQ